MKGNILYYYLGAKDPHPEGIVQMAGATLTDGKKGDNDKTFHIITMIQKDCVFSASSVKEKQQWMAEIQKIIHGK